MTEFKPGLYTYIFTGREGRCGPKLNKTYWLDDHDSIADYVYCFNEDKTPIDSFPYVSYTPTYKTWVVDRSHLNKFTPSHKAFNDKLDKLLGDE